MTEILDTTDVSQWKHVSGINNPVDIGTRAINIEELKRSEWLTGPAWLNRPEIEWPKQVNLIFASDEEIIPSSVLIVQAEEEKVVSIEEREKAKATIFKLLQQEQFGKQIKSLKAEKEIPKGSNILQFSPFLDEEGLIRAKGRIGKS